MTTYGFIGLGSMGTPMAVNLARHRIPTGDRLLVWNRSVRGFLEILGGGFGGSRVLELKAANPVSGTYPPTGKAVYMIKDLGFVRDESERTGVAVPQAELSMDLYRGVVEADLGDEDVSVVHALIRRRGRSTG